jgi:hypothetical protein
MKARSIGREREPRAVFAQWAALLGPPMVWLTQFEARYALAGMTGSATRFLGVLIGIASLLVVGLCGLVAYREWRLANASPLDQTAGVGERTRFMGALAILSSGLFFLAVGAQMLAEFFISPGKS